MRRLFLMVAFLMVSPALYGQAAFDLLKYIPPQANTVAVINTSNILNSQRAQREGWAKKEHTEYLAGAVPLNPLVERMVFAKELRPENLGSGGTIALMPVTRAFTMADLAKRVGGEEVKIGEEPGVLSKTGVHYFQFGERLIGTVRTDNKQEIGRWLRFTKTSTQSQLHPMLGSAVASTTRDHIMIALDTEHMFENHEVDLAVVLSKSIQTDQAQVDFVKRFFRNFRGIVFTANINNDGIQARVTLQSTDMDLKLNPEFVKAFVIETMARNGAMLQDMERATAATANRGVNLTFQISDQELARVMSLILPPAAIPADSPGITVASDKVTAERTNRYFVAVNGFVDDVRNQMKKATDYEKTALWHDTAANRIEMLSTIGVDPKVVEYGFGTIQRLHMLADSLRGVPAKVNELQSEVYAMGFMPRRGLWAGGGMRVNPFAFGNANIQTNAGEIANKQARVVKEDEKNRKVIWDGIDAKRSEMRAMIAEKYGMVTPERR